MVLQSTFNYPEIIPDFSKYKIYEIEVRKIQSYRTGSHRHSPHGGELR